MNIVNKIKSLKLLLNKPNFNLNDIYKQIDQIYKYKEITSYEYLNNLLYPEKNKDVKVPNNMPLPSCTFQLKNQFKIRTNNKGNLVLCMNPFFLASESIYGKVFEPTYPPVPNEEISTYTISELSSLWYNNALDMDGSSPDNRWIPLDIGQVIPDVYSKYRLVSGVITMKYTGPLDEVQGTVGGSILLTNEKYLSTRYKETDGYDLLYDSMNTYMADYTKLDYLRNGMYHIENPSIEGVRMLYFPPDKSYEEFKDLFNGKDMKIDYTYLDYYRPIFSSPQYKDGFNWFLYAYNCRPRAFDFEIEYILNFECLPAIKYINYIHTNTTLFGISAKEKKDIIEEIRKNAIKKLNN